MKKAVAYLLALSMVFALCGCGSSEASNGDRREEGSAPAQSEYAKQAQDAIDAIGEVSLDSKEAILYAEKLYGILTDKEKEQVNNRLDLVNAREQYDRLVLDGLIGDWTGNVWEVETSSHPVLTLYRGGSGRSHHSGSLPLFWQFDGE